MARKPVFPVAFCEKIEGNITPYALFDIIQKDERPDKELLKKEYACFCADESCRRSNNTQMAGVGCFVKTRTSPHFRTFPKQEHSDGCIWGFYNQVLDGMLKNKAEHRKHSRRSMFADHTDSETFIDVWSFTPDDFEPDTTRQYSEAMANAKTQSERTQITMRHHHHGCTQTVNFDELVDTFIKIRKANREDLWNTAVKIAGIETTYRKGFQSLAFMRFYEPYSRVFHGWARIASDNNEYQMIFNRPKSERPMNKAANQSTIPSEVKIAAHIPHALLTEQYLGKEAQKMLQTAVKGNSFVDVYIYGHQQAAPDTAIGAGEERISFIIPASPAGITIRPV